MNLGGKILIYIIVLVTIPTLANSYLNYQTARTNLTEQILHDLELTAETEAGYVLEFMNSAEKRAVDFSSDGFIRDSVGQIHQGDEKTAAALSNHLIDNKQSLTTTIYGINVFNRSGNVIASTDKNELSRRGDTHAGFTASRDADYGTAYTGDIAYLDHFGFAEPSMVVSAPLTDKVTGEHIGVIANYIALDELNKVLSGERLKELGKETSARNRRQTLAIYLANSEGRLISDMPSLENGILERAIETVPVAECSLGRDMRGVYANSMGIPVVGASACLPNGWTLMVEISENEALAGLQTMRETIFLIVTLIILFAFVMAFLLSRLLTIRFSRLAQVANEISEGNLSRRVEVHSRDEFGQFAQSFNNMAAKLQTSYETMEERVWDRTKMLDQAKTRIESEKAKMETIIMSMGEGLIATDDKGRILLINHAAGELLCADIKKCIGKQITRHMRLRSEDGKPIQPSEHPIHQVLRKGVMLSTTSLRMETSDKSTFPAHLSIAPVVQSGETVGAIFVFRDITKEKEIDRMKSEFIAIASHQLRTPLSTIKMFTELLADKQTGPLNRKQKHYTDVINMGSDRVIRLVNELLNVARLEAGTIKVTPEPVQLESFIQEILSELKGMAKEKKCSVRFSKPKKKLPKAEIDEVLLHQVVFNLVANAIHYSPTDGCSVSVKLEKNAGGFVISVSDKGIGIPRGLQTRVFEKFFRADNAAAFDPSGTGLGLYIAKMIMNTTGGTLEFDSVENKGTTFYVTIPLTGMIDREGTTELA
ncbi:MAG: ATP-binding protein [Candidatus Kerfeldbacteria bacterium]